MIIQGRCFADGGYGETNNPSWEAQLHFQKNHTLSVEQQLVMINIGTGTLPEGFDEAGLPQRPWWTHLLPNGLVEALGLLSDLVKMATEWEQRAKDLYYISDRFPDQLFFHRFSADTGIHDIKLDDWQAVTDADGPNEIEVKTTTYLRGSKVRTRLQAAAEKLADVYVARNSPAEIVSPSTVQNETRIDLSIPLEGSDAEAGPVFVGRGSEFLSIPLAGERLPSLGSSSDATQSPGSSPPATPDPSRRTMLPPLITDLVSMCVLSPQSGPVLFVGT
ncbi:uncharacterized protein Z518_02262 [Rhinocladiella mackenziei CBS 650.93]|uniref:Rhinocladiella mackenziei CBS 650.93 unplaced genomic scaffold supercont1.2, whole genome shotgun sequence n=1 Tax=Rhinocladiella mackenziei CBS 650.93 TaxID=1442369 RepID=A0A0D2IP42_9EURO|nr:uncharacterized protein Z518_02262 [Rhinocladiella mackenziei CBS 650.93]KIX07609.1 hypothetical protein Z518_02262 [Rhinocladiella mackenziei CBS 650.93]